MFSVVVCTMNNQTLLQRCLSPLFKDSLVEQIVIVDNNSLDGTAQYLQSIKNNKLVVVTNNNNNGVIKARNQGLVLATSKYTIVLDDDQFPSNDTISRYADTLEKHSIVGCEAQIMDFKTGLTRLGDKCNFTYVGAGGMCSRTSVWHELGMFDEVFQPAYFEDPDFCLKAKAEGYTIGLVEKHGIVHKEHSTLSRRGLGFDKNAVMSRNRKIFLSRYGVKSSKVVTAGNSKKIKILFVLRNVNVGGVQKNTLDIVKSLSSDKYEFAVFVADTHQEGDLSGDLSQYAKIYYNRSIEALKETRVYRNVGTKVQIVTDRLGNTEIIKPGGDATDERYPNLNMTPSFRLLEIRKVQNMKVEDVVNIFKPDIVHYQRDLSRVSKQLLTMKNQRGFKILRTVHSSTNPTNVTGYDKIVLLTRSGLAKLVKNHKGVPAVWVPNGVDTEAFCPVVVPKKNIIFTHTRLAKLLKMTCHKDFYFNVARAVLEQTGFAYKFVVMGADKAKYEDRLMAQAVKVGIEDNFIVENALYGRELTRYINSCFAWFYPMAKDCFPLAILEAMSCGVPVVTSSLRGIKEMIINGKQGLISLENNESAFVNNIISILNNQKYGEELGRSAREKVIESFSLNSMIVKYDKLYETLI